MKQIKFLLSLAVALLIVVPVLAQDAAWGVSGDASATYKLKTVYDKGHYDVDENNDPVTTSEMDDVTINVKFNAAGEVSPYVKFQYDAKDENRWWLGGTFTKGNFKGEANAKVDGDLGEIDVDTAWVTYTMGAFEFKFDKGGKWSTDDTFKTTYTASDMIKVYVALSRTDLQMDADEDEERRKAQYNYAGLDAIMGTNFPLVNAGANITAGMIKANVDMSFAMIVVSDLAQAKYAVAANEVADGETASDAAETADNICGTGFNFFELNADVTATIAEGMTVKVYGAYGLNLDTFGNDSGYSDSIKANEQAAINMEGDGFNDATSMKAGLEAKGMGATFCVEYKSVFSGALVTENEIIDEYDDATLVFNGYSTQEKVADTKMTMSFAYDVKVGEMTVTPKVEWVDNMVNNSDDDETDELNVTLKAAVSF